MADFIEFTPKGLYIYSWDKETRKQVRRRPKKVNILTYLRLRCEIAEGTTLKNIFDAVDRYSFLKTFVSQYSWCRHIDEFHEQAKEPNRFDPDDTEPLDYLEIYHWPEVSKYSETKKHPGGTRERIVSVDFDTSVGFHGIGHSAKGQDEYGNPNPAMREDKTTQYSVSCTQMWKLANLPVKLKKDFEVYSPWEPKKRPDKILSAQREFTFLDVLDAIYWDISFYGGPEESAEFLDEMKERAESLTSGEVAGIPIEQLAKRIAVNMTIQEEIDELPEELQKKVILHPDVVEFFGVDPNSIPLDDKEILRPDES
jgi:hypothetical protein